MSNSSDPRTAIRRPGAGVSIDRFRLIRLRQEALLSRVQLARKMTDSCDHGEPGCKCYSITPDAIAKIENGYRRPKTSTLRRLCEALECSPDDLLAPEEHPPGSCLNCGALYGHEPGCPDAT